VTHGAGGIPHDSRRLTTVGLEQVDRLETCEPCFLSDYLRGASEYVRRGPGLAAGPKKAAQIRLSTGLARALVTDLRTRLPVIRAVAGEVDVAGALRTARADVSEFHPLDGLRLAVEIKPINLAVGRNIWNRFGDIRTFAVNLHLKFPFAVIGGVLAIPTYEEKTEPGQRVETRHLVERAVSRLLRAGGRRTEADAPHLLEAIAVVLYDPDSAELDPEIPRAGHGLRWSEFVDALAVAYEARFE
jgi:hypothetical protein